MNVWGANADELDAIGSAVERAADLLESNRVRLNSQVHHAQWRGAEADQFRREWDSLFNPALARSSSFLRAAAAGLSRNAREQRAAAGGGALPSAAVVERVFRSTQLRAGSGPSIAGLTAYAAPILASYFKIRDSQVGVHSEAERDEIEPARLKVVDFNDGTTRTEVQVSATKEEEIQGAASIGLAGLTLAASGRQDITNTLQVEGSGRIGSDNLNVAESGNLDLGLRAQEEGSLSVTASGVNAGGTAGIYVGTAHGDASATAGGVSVGVHGDAGIGFGVSAHGSAKVTATDIHVSAKVGVWLLAGGSVGVDFDVKPPAVVSTITHGWHDLFGGN